MANRKKLDILSSTLTSKSNQFEKSATLSIKKPIFVTQVDFKVDEKCIK